MQAKRGAKYNDNPGPGTYDSPKRQSKGVKIGEWLADKAPEDLPGPGNYEYKTEKGKSFKIG